MAKQGMKRPEPERRKNDVPPVPEIQGKAKHGHHKAPPMAGNDLTMENLMNDWDMTGADIQDFWRKW